MAVDYEKFGFNNLNSVLGKMSHNDINIFLRLSNMLDKCGRKYSREIMMYNFGLAEGKRRERARRKSATKKRSTTDQS